MNEVVQTSDELLQSNEKVFTVHQATSGQFIRVHTADHRACPACMAAAFADRHKIESTMLFSRASQEWLRLRQSAPLQGKITARYIRHTTEVSYCQYVKSLNLFFGGLALEEIHVGHLREYQRLRIGGGEPFVRPRRPGEPPQPLPVKAKKVNQEMSTLRRIMRDANCWSQQINSFYQPMLEEDTEVQRALEPDEQDLWLHTCQQKPEWEVIYWYSLLGIGCTLSTNEMRYLRVGDVNLFHQSITVSPEGAKCKSRRRTIAMLTPEVLWAAEKLLERAESLGSCAPQHYVFPFRKTRNRTDSHDPQRPMTNSGLKRLWQQVRAASGLVWFRQYDLRHTGATRDAESGMRADVRRSRMGHETQKMQDHYTHITEGAQRREYARMQGERLAGRSGGQQTFIPRRYA